MKFDWNTFISAYRSASTEIQSLIDSDIIADFILVKQKEYSLVTNYKKLVLSIAYVFLSLKTEEELFNYLKKAEQQLSDNNWKHFQSEIKQFLQNPTRVTSFENVEDGVAVEQPQSVQPEAPKPNTPQQTPETAEDVIDGLRTMENDMAKVYGYGAYRAGTTENAMHPKEQKDERLKRPERAVNNDVPRYDDE